MNKVLNLYLSPSQRCRVRRANLPQGAPPASARPPLSLLDPVYWEKQLPNSKNRGKEGFGKSKRPFAASLDETNPNQHCLSSLIFL